MSEWIIVLAVIGGGFSVAMFIAWIISGIDEVLLRIEGRKEKYGRKTTDI